MIFPIAGTSAARPARRRARMLALKLACYGMGSILPRREGAWAIRKSRTIAMMSEQTIIIEGETLWPTEPAATLSR